MLDEEELDIVSVCTYTVDPSGHDLHTEITLYCVEKGIPCVRVSVFAPPVRSLVLLSSRDARTSSSAVYSSGVVRKACGCIHDRRRCNARSM